LKIEDALTFMGSGAMSSSIFQKALLQKVQGLLF